MTHLAAPLAEELVDELLSAQLDGELDGAAADLGVSVAAVLTALAATPGVEARRRALQEAVRVSTAAPAQLPPLDRARMVRAASRAMRAGTPSRSGARYRWLGAAAAVAAAVATSVVLLRGGSRSDPSSAGRRESAATTAAARSARAEVARDLGVVDSADDLRRALLAPGPATPSNGPSGPPGTNALDRPASPTVANETPSGSAQAAACLDGLPSPPGTTDIRLAGRARFRGRPVAVAVARVGRDDLAWAFDPRSCAVALFYSTSR